MGKKAVLFLSIFHLFLLLNPIKIHAQETNLSSNEETIIIPNDFDISYYTRGVFAIIGRKLSWHLSTKKLFATNNMCIFTGKHDRDEFKKLLDETGDVIIQHGEYEVQNVRQHKDTINNRIQIMFRAVLNVSLRNKKTNEHPSEPTKMSYSILCAKKVDENQKKIELDELTDLLAVED